MIKSKFQKRFGCCSLTSPRLCKTEGIKFPLVFCMDCVFQQTGKANTDKHCDEVVFSAARKATGVYCIENKSRKARNVRMSEVQEQLQGGADAVSAHLSANEKICFLPVLATKHGVKVIPSQRRIKVKCGGESKSIRILDIRENANLPPL